MRYNDSVRKAGIDSVKKGMSYYATAKSLNVSIATVRRWCRKENIESIYSNKNLPRFFFKSGRLRVLNGITYFEREPYSDLRDILHLVSNLEREFKLMNLYLRGSSSVDNNVFYKSIETSKFLLKRLNQLIAIKMRKYAPKILSLKS